MKIFLISFFIGVVAIALYLDQEPTLQESMQRGREIYADFCVTCHLEAGEGVSGVFPPLADSDYLQKNREASIRGVKFGQKGELIVNGETYDGVMAPMGLEDEEIADVMNYVMNSFGNTPENMVTVAEVSAISEE